MSEKVFYLTKVWVQSHGEHYYPYCVRWAGTQGEAEELARSSADAASSDVKPQHGHDRRFSA